MAPTAECSALHGRAALVTGGAVRIGRAIVEALADEGCRVAVHYNRSGEAARDLVAQLRRAGVEAIAFGARLDRESACERLIERAAKWSGGLDFLVNNASVFTRQPFVEVTQTDLLGQFWPNLFAPVLLTRAFAAQAVRGGCVINLLDRRIASNDASCIPYLLGKQALASFTLSAALALAPRIRVNAVAPGPVLPPPGKSARHLVEKGGRMPLERRILPADVAQAVVALLRLPATTGQIVYVDGGQHLLGNGV